MHNSCSAAGAAHLFISAKATTAVPARPVLLKDVLVQASLDPQVRSIDYVPAAEVASETVKLAAIVIVRDDGRFWLDVADGRPLRDVDEGQMAQAALRDLGLRPLTLAPADIRREPRLTNARLVWSYNQCPVGLTTRMWILAMLADDGPMSLGRLLSSVHADRDPTAAVMALACSDLVTLDLDECPLGPETTVRCRT
jgi:hypothetical protein